jgi:hypothetical protein
MAFFVGCFLASAVSAFDGAQTQVEWLDAKGSSSRDWPVFILLAEGNESSAVCNGFFFSRSKNSLRGVTAQHCFKRAKARSLNQFFALARDGDGKIQRLPLDKVLQKGQLSDDIPQDIGKPVLDYTVVEFSTDSPSSFSVVALPTGKPREGKEVTIAGFRFYEGNAGFDVRAEFSELKCRLHPELPSFFTYDPASQEKSSLFNFSFSGRGADHDKRYGLFFDACSLIAGQSGSLIASEGKKPMGILTQAVTSSWVWNQMAAERFSIREEDKLVYRAADDKTFAVPRDRELFLYGLGLPLWEAGILSDF